MADHSLRRYQNAMGGAAGQWVRRHAAVLFLAAITLGVFGRVAVFDFVSLDDSAYVYENRYVQAPFTARSLRWAFTTNYQHNWHPVTWLSHMADYALFGLRPGAHHLANVFFHLISVILVYWILARWTGLRERSAAVAAVFAVHPLHVESVAWIAERKDVLSGCFGLLSLAAYCRYAKRGYWRGYAVACLALALALMSKSMLVPMPVLMLLFDFWPLGRTGLWKKAAEKWPFFVMAAAAASVAMAFRTHQEMPLPGRLANACVAYTWYLGKFFWPSGLAAHYPYPFAGFPEWRVAFSAALLAGISAAAVALRQRRPYLATGWFWYLAALAPAAGFVQIGSHLVADRYSYVPLTGLAIMAVWLGGDLAAAWRAPPWARRAAAAAGLAALMAVSYRQTGYWRNGAALYARALAVAPGDAMMLTAQANERFREGRYNEAAVLFREATRIAPKLASARHNLGLTLDALGRTEEAIACYRRALALKPGYLDAHVNIALALSKKGRVEKAIRHLRTARKLDPEAEDVRAYLAAALGAQARAFAAQGHAAKAEKKFLEAFPLAPSNTALRMDYARFLVEQGRIEAALGHYRAITASDPANSDAWFNQARLYEFQKATQDAVACYRKVLELNPSDAAARAALIRLGGADAAP